ncbi:LIM domain-containing protein [[Clostridium] colinum]|uniref:hypothetical protein n=1 Tax=[Clostridium] colinum TaxID=36835 RepID=UPI002023ECE0|nr:hypothetical protein [[Clostridium] colinum]
MCNECNQYICDSRCPYADADIEKECCMECGNILEKGEEVYVNEDNKPICTECMESLEVSKIIEFFKLQKEVI